MVLKKIKATNNSRRNVILPDYKRTLVASSVKAPRSLFQKLKKHSGRNVHTGRVDTRHQKGGSKKIYRNIQFQAWRNDGMPGKIVSREYDPYRSAFISLVVYENGRKDFILSPEGAEVGTRIISGESEDIPIEVGNNLPLRLIPTHTSIHNLELVPKKGAQLLRSAGTWGEVVSKDEDGRYVTVKVRSKELRRFHGDCRATIGKVSNSEHNLIRLGKAGRNAWRGVGPTVRGSAKNMESHPHGAGSGGKSPIGMNPKTPWGKPVWGKTRRARKPSSKFIIRNRRYFKNKENR